MSVTAPAIEYTTFYAGNRWVEAEDAPPIRVFNPADRSFVGSAPDVGAHGVDIAVRAARQAFDEGPWRSMSGDERAVWMERLADELERRGPGTAALVTAEMGAPSPMSAGINGAVPAIHLRYYAGLARQFQAEVERPNITREGASVLRSEPLGVAGLIIPWNYPQSLLTSKLAPALAVGCTVVIKPAAETPLDALVVAEAALSIGFPEGVINVVTGGRETGAALVAHPGVDKIAFTGSTAAGRLIGAECGRRLIPVTLELGGKSAAIILDDADMSSSLDVLRQTSFMNTGQTCFLLSRVLVPRERVADYSDGLVDVARSFVVGDPTAAGTDMGPLVSERIRSRVRDLVKEGVDAGARVLTGGRDVDGLDGYFYEPTIVVDADHDNVLVREEIFGPVVTIIPYDTVDEAVRISNSSDYGLGGAVLGTDRDRALSVARRMDTGTVGLNSYRPDMGMPFGGFKASGLGKENGPEALQNYLRVKSIYV